MSGEDAYLLFGGALCAALLGIIVFYYSRRRHDRVERAKYEMLKDDDERPQR
ncbi:MAG TPA: CcoQ/FixQ family Cbb3-type cytochrome c oxidase assembly chaperone [Anaeromyxobacteraceae bacterium]|nr:CcoQ/FixQ family Cbb3-type cytochrome c oxidase assembly chaperone [Anaeromyxobacteraceae bacterium]